MNPGPRLHHDRPDACRTIGGAVNAHLADEDLIDAQCELDACDGYVVLAFDPQTGEVDAHGPFVGLHALDTAETMRHDLDREELADVVVRVVRWHTGDHSVRAA